MTLGLHPEDEALLSAISTLALTRNGVPDASAARDRERAAASARELLHDVMPPEGLRTSPLGAAWSRDLDCHVDAIPSSARLRMAGWLSLDELLRRLHRPGAYRWAVVEEQRVLTGADLHLDAPPTPVTAVLNRCERRGEVRGREVLELRALLRSGAQFPATSAVLSVAADVEALLGGTSLQRWCSGGVASCPAPLPRRGLPLQGATRAALVRYRDALRPRLIVALSGIDGAGKSTLADELIGALDRCGVPAGRVWSRPGMSAAALPRVRRFIKRLMGEATGSGMERRASHPGAKMRTRAGVLGWAWSLYVTLAFVIDVRRQHLRARGVVVYDRHIPDALVTLNTIYGGTALGLQRALIRMLLPHTTTAFYLNISPSAAFARKPEMFTQEALARQIDEYHAQIRDSADTEVLDAARPTADLVTHILCRLL